jgi:hypothetical protein
MTEKLFLQRVMKGRPSGGSFQVIEAQKNLLAEESSPFIAQYLCLRR